MRIRKRSVPLSFSNLCPVNLPDPQVAKTPSLLQHPEEKRKQAGILHLHPSGDLSLHEESTHFHHRLSDSSSSNQSLQSPMVVEDPPRSDLQLLITRGRNGWVCSDVCEITHDTEKNKEKESEELQEEAAAKKRSEEKKNNLRRGSSLGAEAEAEARLPLVLGSSHQVGRWCEGEKAIPLKKRRGSFERKVTEEDDEETIAEKMKKMKTKMKSKTNKKCIQLNDGDDQGEGEGKGGGEEKDKGKIVDVSGTVKKRERGSVLMEGSRCSRVNGRGWRCCQQTLVGYSLCEHHLGKGRLRSMSSVRSRASAVAKPNDDGVHDELRSSSSSSVQEKGGHLLLDEDGDEDEEKPLMITKKRKKIGMVKARSISSLLGQTNNTNTATDSSKSGGIG